MTRGRQLVFVPGLACTSELFAAQIEALGSAHVIRVATTDLDDSIGDMAARLLDEVVGSFVLIGLSMGGYVALEVMRRAASRVLGLVLLDTSAALDEEAARERRLRLIDLAADNRLDDVHAELWPRLVAPHHLGDRALEMRVRAMLETTGPDAFIRQQNAILTRRDSRDGLASIAAQTLVVVGEHDVITPIPAARTIAEGIASARLDIVGGAGHLSSMEAPAAVTLALAEFLEAG